MAAKYGSIIRWLWLLVLVWACASGPAGMPSRNVRRSVAVLDFENLSPLNAGHADLGELLTARAVERIEETGRYDVVERQRLALILEELRLGTSMVADRQTQLRLGEITGARLMVFGSYQIMKDQLRLDVRLVDVESGRVINTVSQVADEHNLRGWLDVSVRCMDRLLHN